MAESTDYDLIIVGGACAGLSAATYAARRALKTLVLTKDIGGQIATTPSVENYPGIDFITGPDLGQLMYEQAVKWGATVTFDEVRSVDKLAEKQFTVKTIEHEYTSKAVILAYGKTPRSLGIPGESTYAGKGVSYCVTCDAPLYRKKTTVVVGGGNSAMEGALILSDICEKVYLVHRRDAFRGEAVLLDRIHGKANIELVLSSAPVEVLGDERFATSLVVEDITSKAKRQLDIDGIFVEIGFIVYTDFIKHLVTLDRLNQVITTNSQETSTPGVFAAGDLTDTPFKQAVISASEGAKAALTAYSYINDGAAAGVDWTAHSV